MSISDIADITKLSKEEIFDIKLAIDINKE